MTKALSHPDYPAFLAALKDRILHARTSAVRAINRDLVLLYWDIGRGIVEKQQLYLVHTSPEFLSQAVREDILPIRK